MIKKLFKGAIELGILCLMGIYKRIGDRNRARINKHLLFYGSRILKLGAAYEPGMVIKTSRSGQQKLVENMYYNFRQNAITYDLKGLRSGKRKR